MSDKVDLAKILNRDTNWVAQRSRMKDGKFQFKALTISVEELAILEKRLGHEATMTYLNEAADELDVWAAEGDNAEA